MNQSAYSRALKILLARPHFEAELRNKLLAKNIAEEDIDPIIEDLKKRRYINDDEQVVLYIAELSRKGFGSYQIVNKLVQKGFDPDKAQALAEKHFPREAEKENLLNLLRKKKLDPKKISDIKEKKKLFDSLHRKGFSAELIMEVLH
jgi:regulatory protein